MLCSFVCLPECQGGICHQPGNPAVNVLDLQTLVARAIRVIFVVSFLDFSRAFDAFRCAIHGVPKLGECTARNGCHPAIGHWRSFRGVSRRLVCPAAADMKLTQAGARLRRAREATKAVRVVYPAGADV